MLLVVASGCARHTATLVAVNPVHVLPTGSGGMSWWNDTVFYEIFVRSFYDSNGDGIGDLKGLIERLDYLNDGDPAMESDLGVTGIWLMPIMPATSYHGYDVTDYLSVNPAYGTLEDVRRLLSEARSRGMRVILDLVINHTSREHLWFRGAIADRASPYRDYYLWSETDPGYPGPLGKAWHLSPTGYYYGVFGSDMPDLNLTNPEVVAEIERIIRFWLEEIGVDGFRLDGAKYYVEEGRKQENTASTYAWLQSFQRQIKAVQAEAVTVGEIAGSTTEIARYVGEGMDLAFEFETARAIVSAAKTGLAGPMIVAQDLDAKVFPPGQFATFITNHDQNRVMSELAGDIGKAKVAASLLLTGPGVPFIYYGEEIGMTGVKPDEDIRLPLPWAGGPAASFTSGQPWRTPKGDTDRFSVAAQTNDAASLLSHYRRLIRLRNDHEALRIGDWLRVWSKSQAVHAFLRRSESEALLVVINLSGETTSDYALSVTGADLAGRAAVELLSGAAVRTPKLNQDGGFKEYLPLDKLAPYGTYVIQLQ